MSGRGRQTSSPGSRQGSRRLLRDQHAADAARDPHRARPSASTARLLCRRRASRRRRLRASARPACRSERARRRRIRECVAGGSGPPRRSRAGWSSGVVARDRATADDRAGAVPIGPQATRQRSLLGTKPARTDDRRAQLQRHLTRRRERRWMDAESSSNCVFRCILQAHGAVHLHHLGGAPLRWKRGWLLAAWSASASPWLHGQAEEARPLSQRFDPARRPLPAR